MDAPLQPVYTPPRIHTSLGPLHPASGRPTPCPQGCFPSPCLLLRTISPWSCRLCWLLSATHPPHSQTMADRPFSCLRSTQRARRGLFKTDPEPGEFQGRPRSPFPPSIPNHLGRVSFEPFPLGPQAPAGPWELHKAVGGAGGRTQAYNLKPPKGVDERLMDSPAPQPAWLCHSLRELCSTPETAPGMFSHQLPWWKILLQN